MTKRKSKRQERIAEAVSFLQGPGRAAALRELGKLSLIVQEGNTLYIGRGTAIEARITRTRSGIVTPDRNGRQIPVRYSGPQGHSRFDVLWRAIKRKARTALLHELQAHTATTPNADPREQPHPTVYTIQTPEVKAALDAAAESIRQELQPHRVEDPLVDGTAALHAFLGPRRVRAVLKVAGNTATVENFTRIWRDAKVLAAVGEANPNILTVALHVTKHRPEPPPYLTGRQGHPLASPTEFYMAEAQGTCERAFKTAFQNLPLGDTPAPTFGQVWRAVQDLDPHIVRSVFELDSIEYTTRHHLLHLTALAYLGIIAGNNSPWALRVLLQNRQYLTSKGLTSLAAAFLKEANHLADPPERSMLTNQLQTAATWYRRKNQHREQATPTSKQLALSLAAREIPQWDDIKTHLVIGQHLGIRQRRLLSAPYEPLKPPTGDQMEAILKSRYGDEIRLLTSEVRTMHNVPGQRTALYEQGQILPILLFTKEADGRITAAKSFKLRMRPDLDEFAMPNPEGSTKLQDTADYNQIQDLKVHTVAAHLKAIWPVVAGNTRRQPPGNPKTSYMLQHSYIINPEGYPRTEPASLAGPEFREALEAMEDPRTYWTAHQLDETVTPNQYSLVHTLREDIPNLLAHNPGALAWAYFQTPKGTELSGHPSQLITAVRNAMIDAGLKPTNWRFATTMGFLEAKAIMQRANPQNAATIINAAAKAHATPDHTIGHWLHTVLTRKFQMSMAFRMGEVNRLHRVNTQPVNPEMQQENEFRLLFLACRESGQRKHDGPDAQAELVNELLDSADYVDHLTDTGENLMSTTWPGLRKASDHWHRQQANERRQTSWAQHLSLNDGRYRAWHSSLPELSVGPYTIIPLTDERMLHFEAASMDHCVGGYGMRCASGSSRIFSITKDGQELATSELRPHEGVWKEVQTRSRHNHTAPAHIQAMMRELAARYSEAEEEESTRSPTTWWVMEDDSRSA